jgi:hypothetical protein
VELSFDDQRGWKWDLFADQAIDSIETCAISCAVIALSAAGGPGRSAMADEAAQTLLKLQLPSGGWTSWLTSLDDLADEDPEEALVVDTYFALSALHAVEMDRTEQFARGLDWFREAQDPATGAWGFYPTGRPQLLPTCMAIVSLCHHERTADTHHATRGAVDRGVAWLLSQQGPAGSPAWPVGAGAGPSAVHTAWALRALIAAGHDAYSPPVVAAREWLLDNVADRGSVIDHYVTPGLTLAGRRRASRAITHINFPEGIIVRGLLLAGAYLLDSRLLAIVELLIDNQQPDGYWRCLHAPKEQPIYALTDACTALRLFLDQVREHEPSLRVSEQILEHRVAVFELVGRVDTLLAQSAATAARLGEVTVQLDDVNRQLAERRGREQAADAALRQLEGRLVQVNQGLAVLRPLMWFTRLVLRWPVLALLIVLQIVAYCLAAFAAPPGYRLLSLAGGGVLTLVAAITFWAQMHTPEPTTPHSPT